MFGMSKPNAPDGLGLELSVLGTTLLAEPETGSSTPPAADDDAPLMKQYSTESGVVDDDPKIIQSEDNGRSSIPEASFNLINSIVGAGMIGIPFAFKEAGLITGIFLMIMMGVLTDYSLRLLIHLSEVSGRSTYQNLVFYYAGRSGFIALSFAQFMFPFFGMCAYSIIVGQMYPLVFTVMFGDTFLSDRHPVIAIMSLLVMIPLALKRDIAGLARWSLLAIAGVVFLAFALIIGGTTVEHPKDRGPVPTVVEENVVQAIGVMAFAYVCHHNVFLVYESLKDANEARMAKATHLSLGTSCVLMLVVGIAGYLPFGAATSANVLDNFPEDDKLITAGRVFFGMVVMLTYPIECFVAREVIVECFFAGGLTLRNHILVTLAICGSVLAIALLTNDLGLVFEINGVVCANILAYSLPGFLGAVAFRDKSITDPERYKPVLLLIFGAAVFLIGVVMIVLEQLEE
eukprot:m.15235 g.15235  ORF g.15235 m.15235 type:complete len:459 (+) comp4890_c0_seq2:336-1712(+)